MQRGSRPRSRHLRLLSQIDLGSTCHAISLSFIVQLQSISRASGLRHSINWSVSLPVSMIGRVTHCVASGLVIVWKPYSGAE